jgi:hypothetical protein
VTVAASLDDIEAGLFAALGTLLETALPAGPFKQTLRFAGEPQQQGRDKRVPLAPQGRVPAAMLAFEREVYAADAHTLGKKPTGFVGTSTWRVFVVASELRGDDAATKGSVTTGVLALASAVIAATAGLAIAGLYRGSRVELIDTVPLVVQRGQYVWLVRLAAARFVDRVQVDTSVALERIDIDVNKRPEGDAAFPNPLDRAQVDTTAP